MIHSDPTNRLLIHQEIMATAQARQRRNLSIGFPMLAHTTLSNNSLPLLARMPSCTSSMPPTSTGSVDHSDFLTSLLIMHRQERIRREHLSHHLEKSKFAPAASTASSRSMLKPSKSSSACVVAKLVTPLNIISRAPSPVYCEPRQEGTTSSSATVVASKKVILNSSNNSKKDNKWLSTLEELKVYKNTHGDCIVPRGYSENPRLASWVAEQRKQYKLLKDGKQSSITPERVMLLQELGFAWNAQEAAWGRHMHDLKKFRHENGHCNVPLNDPQYPKLGLWVKEQRRHYTLMKQGKQSHMTEERAIQLDAVDFCWDTHEATWLERLRELAEFKERFGSCIVPTSYHENPKLGTWVHHQRRQYKKFKEGKTCHITEERIQALEALDFVWYPRDKSTHSLSDCSSSVGSSESDLESLDFRPRKRQRASYSP